MTSVEKAEKYDEHSQSIFEHNQNLRGLQFKNISRTVKMLDDLI